MNNHYGLYSWFAHGEPNHIVTKSHQLNKPDRYCINTIDAIDNYEVQENQDGLDCLTNEDYPSILCSTSCNNTPFDDFKITSYPGRNLGEGFTVTTKAGGPAFLGNTRFGWVGTSTDLYEAFANLVNTDWNLGVAELMAKSTFPDHYLNYSHNLVGCPETEMWTDVPSLFTNASVTYTSSSVTVSTGGVAGCDICACSGDKGVAFHEVVHNVSSAVFNTPIRPLYVTITKHNHLPYTTVTGGTFTSDEYWFGNLIVLGSVTMSNGKTLTVLPGTTVKVNGNYTLTIDSGSAIKADEAQFKNNGGGNWYGIRFTSTASSSSYLRNCTLNNASYAVRIEGSSPLIQDCSISDNNYSIYVTGSGAYPIIERCYVAGTYPLYAVNSCDPEITNSKLKSINLIPAQFYSGADGTITRCSFSTISGNNSLLYTAGSGTSPWVGDGSYDYGNVFDMSQTASTKAVHVAGGSPKLGDAVTYAGGYNDFANRSASDYYVFNATGSTIKAENNYWGAPAPQDTWFFGSVDKTPFFPTPQSAGPTWKRAVDPIVDAIAAYRNHDYQNAKDYATQALSEKGDSQESAEALFYFAKASFRLGTLKEDLSYIESYLTAKDAELAHQARNWASFAYAQQGDLKKAEKITLQSPKGTLGERELLLQLIAYYAAYGMETEVARLEKEFLARDYPDDTKDRQGDLAAAKNSADLGMFGYETQPIEARQATANEEAGLIAYPNPFNASTKLAFRIEDAEHVSLAVYNTLGQQVRNLLDGPIQAGRHEVLWDGRDEFGQTASTGIYLCRLLAGSRRQISKILMVK